MSKDLRTLAIIAEHQALIAAQVAKMEAMKATNEACYIMDVGPLYTDKEFKEVVEKLERLAWSVRNLVEQ